ncbi:MAG: DUF922 domain-containing protein [Hymenobacteraceae bacterium]|nr:DUF922 domain-containing protein [Hymenobacteraceae bacterium]
MTFRLLTLLISLLGAWPLATPAFAADPPRPVLNSDSTLLWTPARRLTWADFKGTAGSTEKLHALTSADMNVQVECTNDVLKVNVQAVFRPLESWTKSPDSVPLLRHEQLHFDLTEVHARLLRLSLSKLKMTCAQAQTQLQPLIDAAFTNWQHAQDRYDEEARHGLDREGQARWEKQITDQLRVLK